MRKLFLTLVSLVSSSLFLSPSFADDTPAKLLFSPYADITLNTHWDPDTQDMAPMDLTSIALKTGIKSFHLAFITDGGQCQPAWGGQQSYGIDKKWGQALAHNLKAKGITVIVAFGGASGNDLSLNCSPEQLVSILQQVMTTYETTALDFDIENGTANVPKLMQALQTLQKNNPNVKLSFTLPVLPEGLTPDGKEVVKAAKGANLNFNVNIMAMDYGPSYSADMGDYAIQASTALHDFLKELYPAKSDDQLWAMVEVTPMIGVNDVNTEQFTLKNADAVKAFAQDKKIGGLAMWSIMRDKPCADKWASPTCSGNNLQTKDYEFTQHLNIE